jgi:histidinol-phosphatase
MSGYVAELALALDAAEQGAGVALRHYRREPAVKRKPDGTWVTQADAAAEAHIRRRIAERYPGHTVLGEEDGLAAADGGPPSAGAPTWIVDPIDGTNNYIAGIPIWATLVALRAGGETVVGVCHAPAIGETYDAARGAGARLNGEPIEVGGVDRLQDATVLMTGAETFYRAGLGDFLHELTLRCWRSRGFGDFWGHMLVARGAAHAMVEPELNVWDVAALEPILAEAGGRLTHLDGAPWEETGSCLTTNSAVHHEIVALFEQHRPKG